MGNFMRRHDYILTIDKPCEQDWNSMQRTDIGKFCSHCSNTVVDFTKLTDSQIIQIVEKSSDNHCGRLTAQQLNRLLESEQITNNSRLYKILTGLLLIGTTGKSFTTNRVTYQTEIVSMPLDKREEKKYVRPEGPGSRRQT